MSRFFKFSEFNTNYRTETIAGITTFLAMAYILFVNPIILSDAHMDKGAVFTATALASAIGTLIMALVANYPIALAPGMGLNAFFAYSVVLGMGVSWQTALAGTLVSGIIFVLITVFKIREKIINAIPQDLKFASASGIGLFIAFIGLKESGVIVANKATLVSLGSFHDPSVLLTLFGLFITVILMVKQIKGGIFYGMIITAVVGIIFGVIPMPTKIVAPAPSLQPIFGVGVAHFFDVFTSVKLLVVVLTFLFVEFFDTAGTLMAVAHQAGFLKDNKLPRSGRALFADSSSIVVGGILGTSPTTAYIESSSGVAAGGRTGFSSVITAILFLVALLFSPLLVVVTSQVTSPALIIVGVLMASSLGQIQWTKLEIAIPAFLTLITMPLSYSISTGIALGFIAYPITMITKGRGKELNPIIYVLFVIFLIYFIFLTN